MAVLYGRAGRLIAQNGGFRPGQMPKAETLAGFRSKYRYHLEDRAYASLLASTAVIDRDATSGGAWAPAIA